MAPYYRIAKELQNIKATKRTIKFLALPHTQKINKEIIKSSSDPVIKAICNAAFISQQNPDIRLHPVQKRIFSKHRKNIYKLTKPRIPIARKRKIIQTGGGPFLIALIPALLSTAISAIGSAFLNSSQRN